MSRVLVTGATGFIGRQALPVLAERGYEVHAASRSGETGIDGVHSHPVDLLESGAAAALVAEVSPAHLLHLAWYAEPGEFWSSPENLRWVAASLELLGAFAASGGRRFVGAGTCAEYDWSASGRCVEGETPLRPATLYGACKDALRRMVEATGRERGLSTAWGRVFFLYGPGEHPDRLVPSVALRVLRGESAPCTEGSQVRDFLHVADVAGALVELLAGEVEGPVNIGSGEPVSVADLVTLVGEAAGHPELVELGALPSRPGEPPELVADTGRLNRAVGWTPRYSLREGIGDTVAKLRTRVSSGARDPG
jgi:nucleoside-diphosphate-sugar epimerase